MGLSLRGCSIFEVIHLGVAPPSGLLLTNGNKFRTDVKVPSNTLLEESIAGKNAYGNGGGTQFRLLERIPKENFSNFRFLPEAGTYLPAPIEGMPLEEPIIPFEEPLDPLTEFP